MSSPLKGDSRPDINLEWTLEEEKKQLINSSPSSRSSSNQHKANFSGSFDRADTMISNNLSTSPPQQQQQHPHEHDSSVKMNRDSNRNTNNEQTNQHDNVARVDDNDSLDQTGKHNFKQDETTIPSSPTTAEENDDNEFQHQLLQRNLRNFSFDSRMLRNNHSSQDYGITPYHRYHHRNRYHHYHHHSHSHSHHSTLPTYQEFRASITSIDSMISYENENTSSSEEDSITGSKTKEKDSATTNSTTSLLKPSTTSAATLESFPGNTTKLSQPLSDTAMTTTKNNEDGQDLLLFHSANPTLIPNASLLRNLEEKQYVVQNNITNNNNDGDDDAASGVGGRLHGAPFFTSVSNDNDTSSTAFAFLSRLSSASSIQQQSQYSTTSSPRGETWQHKILEKKHRTFSLDGKMLRNQLQQYKETVEKQSHLRSETSPSGYGAIESSFVTQHQDRLAQDPNYDDENELEVLIPKENDIYKEMHMNGDDHNDGSSRESLRLSDRLTLHDQHLKSNSSNSRNDFIFYFIYALLNTMMSVPSLYGYASVIFNHDAFQPYISTLSKLVIWSSTVHQMSFVMFSSIPFSIAQVQDAGLLFLSCISQYIANAILSEEGTVEEILSTTIAALGTATSTLGLMLVLLGRFNCANAVSYLPLPVVGGYLAFIGYFCVIAGVGLCISQSMIDGTILSDVQILSDKKSLMLATPGIIAAFVMMYITRTAKSDMALPITMVAIPSLFFAIVYSCGYTLDDARRNQWVGEETPPASLSALFELFDINLIRWDLVFSTRCITVWMGMVFVVSFSSCLDVAAISMDMGEPLNVNQELITVGLSNFISGVCLGQSGSYIFSQTILTYRTGFHSRWIGTLCSLMFLYFVVSKVNLLAITPLFFLGSTLIFIGIDLLYEWIIEVAHKLNLSEYLVLIATFVAIQFVGINGGIVFGLIVAVVEYVVTTSQVPSLRRVLKRSRAVWEQQHRRFIQDTVYDSRNPKIITLEITETVFFGSSLLLFSQICDEIGFSATPAEMEDVAMSSPRNLSGPRNKAKRKRKDSKKRLTKQRPRYVVLEMNQVANVDASAARSCFLQLAKLCSKKGVVLCAAGANSRVEWILRSHDVSYTAEEEDVIKSVMLNPLEPMSVGIPSGKLILFSNINECLELCENQLIYEYQPHNLLEPPKLGTSRSAQDLMNCGDERSNKIQLSKIFERILGMERSSERHLLKAFDEGGAAKIVEKTLCLEQKLFARDEMSDCFYVVLSGTIKISRESLDRDQGLGPLFEGDVSYVNVGQIFGYVDFALQRRRSFNAVCEECGTLVAKISQSTIDRLKKENKDLHHIIDKVLLQASLLELANIDVS